MCEHKQNQNLVLVVLVSSQAASNEGYKYRWMSCCKFILVFFQVLS